MAWTNVLPPYKTWNISNDFLKIKYEFKYSKLGALASYALLINTSPPPTELYVHVRQKRNYDIALVWDEILCNHTSVGNCDPSTTPPNFVVDFLCNSIKKIMFCFIFNPIYLSKYTTVFERNHVFVFFIDSNSNCPYFLYIRYNYWYN